MAKTLVVSEHEAVELLGLGECIEAMRGTLAAVPKGEVQSIQRTMIPHPNGNTLAGMASSIAGEGIAGTKVIIFAGPAAAKAGTSQGIVPIFSTQTGALIAIVDGHSITLTRTAATSAVGTDVMANPDANSLCLIGAGRQARGHLEAMALVRKLKTVTVWDLYPEATAKFVADMAPKFPGIAIRACDTAEEAARDADIICTVTPGKTEDPVLLGAWLKPGCHINAVGACSPQGRELDTAAMKKGRLFVDQMAAAKRDAGDFVIPFQKGELDEDHILGEIGEIINGQKPARTSPEDITIFESVGIAAEDLATAYLIYQKARAAGRGVEVEI